MWKEVKEMTRREAKLYFFGLITTSNMANDFVAKIIRDEVFRR